jgi:hypothetical protein
MGRRIKRRRRGGSYGVTAKKKEYHRTETFFLVDLQAELYRIDALPMCESSFFFSFFLYIQSCLISNTATAFRS